jgi:hypothetical protein
MWEPQPLATLRASTACIEITLHDEEFCDLGGTTRVSNTSGYDWLYRDLPECHGLMLSALDPHYGGSGSESRPDVGSE